MKLLAEHPSRVIRSKRFYCNLIRPYIKTKFILPIQKQNSIGGYENQFWLECIKNEIQSKGIKNEIQP